MPFWILSAKFVIVNYCLMCLCVSLKLYSWVWLTTHYRSSDMLLFGTLAVHIRYAYVSLLCNNVSNSSELTCGQFYQFSVVAEYWFGWISISMMLSWLWEKFYMGFKEWTDNRLFQDSNFRCFCQDILFNAWISVAKNSCHKQSFCEVLRLLLVLSGEVKFCRVVYTLWICSMWCKK